MLTCIKIECSCFTKCFDIISKVILVEVEGKEFKVRVKVATSRTPYFQVENLVISNDEELIVQERL